MASLFGGSRYLLETNLKYRLSEDFLKQYLEILPVQVSKWEYLEHERDAFSFSHGQVTPL